MGLVELFAEIPGQSRLLKELEAHAVEPTNSYFFVGPQESGSLAIAKAFSKALLCPQRGCGSCSTCLSIEKDVHPDVSVFERSGPSLSVDDARSIAALSYRSTSGSRYQVIIVPELELAILSAPVLLKSVEEPPSSTIFLLLASVDTVELQTLMSRSVVLRLDPISDDDIYAFLTGKGTEASKAKRAVALAGGRWERALRLCGDDELLDAFSLWGEVPNLLQQDMKMLVELADNLLGAASMMEERRKAEQKKEIADLAEMAKSLGGRQATMTKRLEAQHSRELRRIRSGEIRSGLLVVERYFRDSLASGEALGGDARYLVSAISLIEDTQRALDRNANELLLLVSLFVRLAKMSY